jgi:hypothetical protein
VNGTGRKNNIRRNKTEDIQKLMRGAEGAKIDENKNFTNNSK